MDLKIFQKQPPMRKVLLSLVPIFLWAAYFYGVRLAALALVVFPVGVAVEYLMERRRGRKVSEAVLVTCSLFLLSLPPAVPLWVAAIGIAFGVFMAKEVYGGFGRNVFNPAIAGRLFVYITFPTLMTRSWLKPGAFGLLPDALTSATPLDALRAGTLPPLPDMLLGLHPGSMGESALPLILLAGIYLVATRTASWRIMLSTLGGALLLSAGLYYAGVPGAVPPHYTLLAGSLLFVAVFMATDPVTAPNNPRAHWLYGLLIGAVVVLVRTFSLFSEGTSFAVLLANAVAPLLDELLPRRPAAARRPAPKGGAA
ncbi:RnfABCDGE type electron transport complex subunit D [Spirochaeta thermophila]|uniref:NADH:ubiquinone oxidoreductase, Na translocating, B subunit n=1 Tax=Winmispira thermophila (strain ATCC 49972 / DSM 6192 / RI 19.B1) TaxID=665571 RepID=E0RP91_WINT6|nr:RnfABCDGE type electron transport complex subunit D [Spirochaeta thermophila]ADN01285.1 NADH:ubiquinone oxidoreductase, Na translocating, B subunit [Spirochaeta thermophila DSM 6192]